MTIELDPETEQIVQEEIKSGRFRTVDEVIAQGVRALREKPRAGQGSGEPVRQAKKNLAQFLLESPLRGSGLKLERQKDYPRPIDL